MEYLVTTNTRLEIKIRNVHFFKTKRTFGIILDIIAISYSPLWWHVQKKDGSQLHRRSSTRLGHQPKRETSIVRLKSQNARPARGAKNVSELWWRPFQRSVEEYWMSW